MPSHQIYRYTAFHMCTCTTIFAPFHTIVHSIVTDCEEICWFRRCLITIMTPLCLISGHCGLQMICKTLAQELKRGVDISLHRLIALLNQHAGYMPCWHIQCNYSRNGNGSSFNLKLMYNYCNRVYLESLFLM